MAECISENQQLLDLVITAHYLNFLRGCPSYHLFLTSSRLAVHCWYRYPKLDLLKITKQTEAARIEARWRVRGEPRVGRRRQR